MAQFIADGAQNPRYRARMNEAPPDFRPAGFAPGFLDRGGPYWLRAGDGADIVGLRIGEGHLNFQDAAHGGVLTTLADVALSWAVHRSETPAVALATASLTVNFLGAARLGEWIEAEARIDRVGKRLAYTSGTIRREGEAIATMTAVFSVIRPG